MNNEAHLPLHYPSITIQAPPTHLTLPTFFISLSSPVPISKHIPSFPLFLSKELEEGKGVQFSPTKGSLLISPLHLLITKRLFLPRNLRTKMGQANFMDEIDCGSFFDHIDDLIDFPVDDVVDAVTTIPVAATATAFNETSNPDNYAFPGDVWSAQCDSLPGSASDLSAELSVPYEDIVQLEWLSNFVEDSFSGGSLTMKKEVCSSSLNKNSSHHQFHTSSPVSVLESSSSCSGEKTSPRSPEVVARCGRARSKRPRPATFTPRPAMQLISPNLVLTGPAQPVITPNRPFDCEGFAESRLIIKIPKPAGLEQKKKKKIKITVPAPPAQNEQDSYQQVVRKCMHCEITKTPQWRAGPMGPKTLCNACGVRFKSGRLFPEYRPAASPTFVPAMHSNSHKKVLEMRNKCSEKIPPAGDVTMIAKSEESIPNNSNIGYASQTES